MKNMLNSLKEADRHYQNWELAILDDNSPIPVLPIVEEVMSDYRSKIRVENSEMTFDDKMKYGLTLGKYANRAIRESEADIGILLCDDDELCPKYLLELAEYFNANDAKYCYSNIYLFNPLFPETKLEKCSSHKYNQWFGPINPIGKVDATQVSWRLSCCKEDQAWFQDTTKISEDHPFLQDTDYGFFHNLYAKCGLAQQSGLFAQYKGVHEYQLLWNKNGDSGDLQAYFNKIENNVLL